jgi:hypothetical protein
MSVDAPVGEQDAQFWDWVLAAVIALIVIGVAVWGLAAIL